MFSKDQINQIAQLVAQATAVAIADALSNMAGQTAHPMADVSAKTVVKAVKQHTKPKASSKVAKPAKPVDDKTAKRHAAIIAGFQRRGIKDPQLFTDVKSYQAWLQAGRIVVKGQHGISGLFHRDQTKPLAA